MEIDFTKLKVDPLKMYGGANGNKIGILYQKETYMLKFPPKATLNPAIDYANSCICEYIACQVFASLGINTQETILGRYKDKITVACKDFETDGFIFKDFAHLKNTIINSEQKGYGTELADILETISAQQIIPPQQLSSFFWEMFIGDALLGNFDRHNGNWGFLINNATGMVKTAPVFDCGSCLFPQIDEAKINLVLTVPEEMENRIFSYPSSAIKQQGIKINYAKFLMATKNRDCLQALHHIGGKIDLAKINAIVDNTPFISATYKDFYKIMLKERKEKIIDRALIRNKDKERVRPQKQRQNDAR